MKHLLWMAIAVAALLAGGAAPARAGEGGEPPDDEAIYAQAVNAFTIKNYAEAERLARDLVSRHPRHRGYLDLLARSVYPRAIAAEADDAVDGAVTIHETLLEVAPGELDATARLAALIGKKVGMVDTGGEELAARARSLLLDGGRRGLNVLRVLRTHRTLGWLRDDAEFVVVAIRGTGGAKVEPLEGRRDPFARLAPPAGAANPPNGGGPTGNGGGAVHPIDPERIPEGLRVVAEASLPRLAEMVEQKRWREAAAARDRIEATLDGVGRVPSKFVGEMERARTELARHASAIEAGLAGLLLARAKATVADMQKALDEGDLGRLERLHGELTSAERPAPEAAEAAEVGDLIERADGLIREALFRREVEELAGRIVVSGVVISGKDPADSAAIVNDRPVRIGGVVTVTVGGRAQVLDGLTLKKVGRELVTFRFQSARHGRETDLVRPVLAR